MSFSNWQAFKIWFVQRLWDVILSLVVQAAGYVFLLLFFYAAVRTPIGEFVGRVSAVYSSTPQTFGEICLFLAPVAVLLLYQAFSLVSTGWISTKWALHRQYSDFVPVAALANGDEGYVTWRIGLWFWWACYWRTLVIALMLAGLALWLEGPIALTKETNLVVIGIAGILLDFAIFRHVLNGGFGGCRLIAADE